MGYDFLNRTAQFDCEEAGSGSALLDSSGAMPANDLPDTLSVPRAANAALGFARGTLRSGDRHFTKNFGAGNAWDIRGLVSCTFVGWMKVDIAEQGFGFNIHDATAAGRQALILIPRETNFESTPGPYVAMADGLTSFMWKQLKVNDAVSITLGEWFYFAGGYDAVRNKVFGAWGTLAGDFYYNEIDGWVAGFSYTGTGGTTKIGFWNGEAGTSQDNVDHSLWFNGRALTETELEINFNGGVPLPFDQLQVIDSGSTGGVTAAQTFARLSSSRRGIRGLGEAVRGRASFSRSSRSGAMEDALLVRPPSVTHFADILETLNVIYGEEGDE